MEFFFNGFLIDALNLTNNYSVKENIYKGVDRYCWPYTKNNCLDNKIYQLEQQFEKTNNMVVVSDDIDFINMYMVECKNIGVDIRILLCATEKRMPQN